MNFAFANLSDFLAMGGYSIYVWSAYGVAFFSILALCWHSVRMRYRILKKLKQQLLREEKIKQTKAHL